MNKKITLREIAIFGVLGALMYASKVLMDALPNIHLIGAFVVAITVVYRAKSLLPIYTFVMMAGLFGGFGVWWIPYLYIWTVLFGAVMLLPRNMPKRVAAVVYIAVCSLHGFLYGILYAPFQAFAFGLDFNGTIAWIIAGLPFDIAHGIGNAVCGTLIIPIINVLQIANKKRI